MIAGSMDQVGLERLRIVAKDLDYLRHEWNEGVDDDSLRRSSTVLRRLLVEGELLRAWRDLGMPKQPIVTAPSLEAWLGGIPYDRVAWANAGGAKYRSVEVAGTLQVRGDLPTEWRQRSGQSDPERTMSLKRFVESPCIVVRGQLVTRRDVIKYVANKLGGAHPIDTKRDANNPQDKKYLLLDSVHNVYTVADKEAIYFELLSIGQCAVRAPDIRGFIDQVRDVLGLEAAGRAGGG